jgi:tRNA nucleotidyltransferase (CCA-adding enzyme)
MEKLFQVISNYGRACLVGGYVRDKFLGKTSKDIDVEVFGISPQRLRSIALKYSKVKEVGKAFGILKLTDLNIDLSLPRREFKTGLGHRGFDVEVDPYMSYKEACSRRDFTINAILLDPLTDEIIDPFNGVSDIKSKTLRVTSDRFKEDPLRVLRGVQFAGRFNLKPDPKSFKIMKDLVPQLQELSRDKIRGEWIKLLLSSKPSVGLQLAMDLGILKHFKELPKTPQDPKWHPEGDAWEHTKLVVDAIEPNLMLRLSALCHDLGKPETTKEGISYGHEQAGIEPTKEFLDYLGIKNEKIPKLVEHHMKPRLFFKKATKRAFRRLAKKLFPATMEELVKLSIADQKGRLTEFNPTSENWFLQNSKGFKNTLPKDFITGKDWINLGFKQGEIIGKLIRFSNLAQDNFTKQEIFNLVEGLQNAL